MYLPLDRIKNLEQDRATVILGNGPSLNGHDWKHIKDHFVTIGMNHSWKFLPQPDYYCAIVSLYIEQIIDGFFHPGDLLVTRREIVEEFYNQFYNSSKPGRAFTIPDKMLDVAEKDNIFNKWQLWDLNFKDNGFSLLTGGFALQLATFLGCNPIYLVGFDSLSGNFDNNRENNRRWQASYLNYAADVIEAQTDIKVYNTCRWSAIKGFEYKELP